MSTERVTSGRCQPRFGAHPAERCVLGQRPRCDIRRRPRCDIRRHRWRHLGQRLPCDLGQRLPCDLGQRLPPFATGEASPTIGDAFTAGAGLSQRVRGGSSPPLTCATHAQRGASTTSVSTWHGLGPSGPNRSICNAFLGPPGPIGRAGSMRRHLRANICREFGAAWAARLFISSPWLSAKSPTRQASIRTLCVL